MTTIAERVAKGVEYMDTYGPADWRDRINLERLDIGELRDCIFGQVFGCSEEREEDWCSPGWYNHIDDFYENVPDAPVSDYGFDGPWDDVPELNAEWMRVLSPAVAERSE